MRADDAQTLATSTLDQLAAALERGQSAQLKAFLAAAGRFHRYSFRNVMLISAQCPEATRVAGFNAWRKLGRFVRKGEKGIAIIAPIVLRRTEDSVPDIESTESSIRFKATHVFDVAQTDGEPLPEVAETLGDPGDALDRLKAFVAEQQIALEYADDLGGADGLSKKGSILLRNGMSAANEFSVLVHELAHEMIHVGESRTNTSKDTRELEAEAVAFVVSQAIGLDATGAASDYIQLYRGDRDALLRSLEVVQRAAAHIIAAVVQCDR